MPIKDLQKKDKPGLSRAGVIRLGYKMRKCNTCGNVRAADKCPKCGKSDFKMRKQGEEMVPIEFPVPSDHFVLTDAPGVAEAIGTDKPRELRIWFPFNDIDQVFPAYHQLWSASSLICRGDGERIEYAINPQSGKPIIRDGLAIDDFKTKDGDFKRGEFMACPGNEHGLYSRCEACKPNAMLIVLLRDVPRLAYYQISTTSIHNIIELTEQMNYISDPKNVGKLQGVPFILKLQEREISAPSGKDGQRRRVKRFLLSLEVDPDYYKQLMEMHRHLAAPERKLQIESGEVVDEVAEVMETAQPLPVDVKMEPPEWSAPNGNDDSEFVTVDWDLFCDRVIDNIAYYQDVEHLTEAMNTLKIAYDPENEDFIFEQLSRHASSQADQKLAEETADSILGN